MLQHNMAVKSSVCIHVSLVLRSGFVFITLFTSTKLLYALHQNVLDEHRPVTGRPVSQVKMKGVVCSS